MFTTAASWMPAVTVPLMVALFFTVPLPFSAPFFVVVMEPSFES